MTGSRPADIVRRYFDAWASQDRATVERMAADDFHFTSPLDNRLDRATYFERCWPNSANIRSFDFVRMLTDGELVFVTYELTTQDGRRFRNSEAITVRQQQVCEVEVYFGWDLPHRAAPGSFVEKS